MGYRHRTSKQIFVEAPLPLLFSPCTASNFPMFTKLPADIYHDITRHLPSSSKRSLALVDHACCQLMRSVMFASVTLRLGSKNSLEILDTLHCEMEGKIRQTISIGACIRRVVCVPTYAKSPGDVLSEIGWHAALMEVIASGGLPNLQILDWDWPVPLNASAILSPQSPLLHLRISSAVDCSNMDLGNECNLQTLVVPALIDVSPLLRSTANLRCLISRGRVAESSLPLALHTLSVEDLASHAIPKGVRALTVYYANSQDQGYSLQTHIPSLDRLHIVSGDTEKTFESITTLLECNRQITSLTGISSTLLSTLRSFISLTTLHVTFTFPSILPEDLEVIASLKNLSHLWLSAGHQHGWYYDWVPDHAGIAAALKTLHRLEMLAFTRDTYIVERCHPLQDPSPTAYYHTRTLPLERLRGMITGKEGEIWEDLHRGRMRGVLQSYAEYKMLRWMFVGQLEFQDGMIKEGRRLEGLEARDLLRGLWHIECL